MDPHLPGVELRPGVRAAWSTRADGDFHRDRPPRDLETTRRRFVDLPWSQPDEVHGTAVARVEAPGEHDGVVADALVTDHAGAVLGIWVGDCAPVVLVGAEGRIGAAHAGWRGLLGGVLAATVAAMRDGVGDPTVEAWLGPCIHPCCYEFGEDDLGRLVDRFGPAVVGATRDGRPALDVPTAVAAALTELGVPVTALVPPGRPAGGRTGAAAGALASNPACTGCRADRWFSHRVRRERSRHAVAVWKDPS